MTQSEHAAQLQSLQRQRAWYIKSRNMVANRLQATVAGELGYETHLKESDRKKKFSDADKLIKQVCSGEMETPHDPLILTTKVAIDGFDDMRKGIEKEMRLVARKLPVFAWINKPEQRGFGELNLAIVIGECGDLANYANPGKVWRRMGCAPFTSSGETKMGSTWFRKSKKKLSSAEAVEFGYSPRRRSISYLIGEGLLKQNKSIYRERYDVKKAEAAERDDWTRCGMCNGEGVNKKGNNCSNCKGDGKVMMRCHLHGMLLASKLLYKNLWIVWNGGQVGGESFVETDANCATA